MEAKELYETIGEDYDKVKSYLITDKRITKFVKMFLNDPTFDELTDAMDNEDYEKAFRAAHTLKGICLNLGFEQYRVKASDLTEALRNYEHVDAKSAKLLYNRLKVTHNELMTMIKELE